MRRILLALVLVLAAGCGEKRAENATIPMDQVPETVLKVARQTLPDVTFDTAWKRPNGNFEVRGKMKNGKIRDVQVTPSGEVAEID